ncbi:ABC transporter ATP-binding protein [Schlesneria sp. T3-172]|uniref:ABC transporter ATP-binding protein n=1 Tax=Schlesneria sphaerica TaxID=3373610 RepID=UPI0037C6E639
MNTKASWDGAGSVPALCIKGLTKCYGSFTALDGLTLTVAPGQILGLIGPNGAGKTTTIKILVGLIKPTSGSASIAGVDCLRDAREIKRLVGYMPDKFGAYDNMRVREYLDFFAAACAIPARLRAKRVADVMELTQTAYMKESYVERISHGMQQRVGLARTLLHDPKIVILDEPSNGLDPQARIEMRDLLIELTRQGKTVVVTSHILPELARICQQVAIITHGRLRAFGTVEEIGRQISRQQSMEVQLISLDQLKPATQLIQQNLEEGAEVVASPRELAIRFRTARSESDLQALLKLLIESGIRITQFRELQTDLEEVFISFTRPRETKEVKEPAVAGAGVHV